MKLFKTFLSDECGGDLIEYALLMAFIALVCAVVFVNYDISFNNPWRGPSARPAGASGK